MPVKLKDREWKILIDKIEKEEVILILGDELSMLSVDGQKILLKDYLLNRLVEALNEEVTDSRKLIDREDVKSFFDISYENKREYWQNISSDPYSETIDILSNISPDLYETEAIDKLLSIEKFKTIITTSFDDIAFKILENRYGRNSVLRLGYKVRTKEDDISQKTDKRLLYHLFGKPDRTKHSFVLTEDDLLEFIHCLMDTETRPAELFHTLADKYLLIIGCSYPDWLFRFFFHSLKYAPSLDDNRRDKKGLLADRDLDSELISFLRRMETSVHEDAMDFINQLCDQWHNRTVNSDSSLVIDSNDDEAFISYAHEDHDTAAAIAGLFRKMGLRVWFDESLESGDEYETLIKNKINDHKLKAFIPILSYNTECEGGRFFRKEWKWAADAGEGHFGVNDQFIRPILIDDFKIYNAHVFHGRTCIDLTDPDKREDEIRKIIRSIRRK